MDTKMILFPTDFSKASLVSFQYAVNWASKLNADIDVVHFSDQTLNKIINGVNIEHFENGVDVFPDYELYLNNLNVPFPNLVHYKVVNNNFKTGVLRELQDREYAMVVMGTEGLRGFKELIGKSDAINVLHNIETILCTVPEGSMYDGDIDEMIFLSEFRLDEDLSSVNQIMELANLIKANLKIVHFDTAHTDLITDNLNKYKSALKIPEGLNVKFESIDSLDIEKSIVDYCKQNKTDVISLINHKRDFFQNLFHNNLAAQLIKHLSIPVLSLQSK